MKGQNKALIRVDSSIRIGTGHVMRCLTIAEQIKHLGWEVQFICRPFSGDITRWIETCGFVVHRLSAMTNDVSDEVYEAWLGTTWASDASETENVIDSLPTSTDLLIVDHYGIESQWETQLRSKVGSLVVIDDLANRSHNSDFVIDQNYCADAKTRYHGLVPPDCELLLGPAYALLRPEFAEARKKLRPRNGELHRLQIFFGGTDPGNETHKALRGILSEERLHMEIDVILGVTNPHAAGVISLAEGHSNVRCLRQVDRMSDLMVLADLAVGAGGSSSWERCCLGVPSILSIIASNQEQLAKDLEAYGASLCLGKARVLTGEDYLNAVRGVNNQSLKKMSQLGMALVDGHGTKRVVKHIIG